MPGSPATPTTFAANHPINGRNSKTPNVLKQRLANAIYRAVFCILMLASSAVADVPMFGRILLPAWVQFVVSGVQLSRAEVEVPDGCSPLDPDSMAFSCSTPVE